jgi:hypothetical protein
MVLLDLMVRRELDSDMMAVTASIHGARPHGGAEGCP